MAREDSAASMTQLTPSFMPWTQPPITYTYKKGALPDWFGPGAPIAPQAPQILAGRQFDYPVAQNIAIQPKQNEGVSFATLRAMAKTCDVLRTGIENCKDQICKLEWRIIPRDKSKKTSNKSKRLAEFFRSPDKEHGWETWLRMLLNDMIIIDAATIYPIRARDGSVYALEPIDGSTIKRILDDYGRTPQAPNPAYQQYLKGVPAFDYTRDELLYMPRNPSTELVYGLGYVEQIIITINIALRRQAHQLQYYTNGSTPDLILSLPKEWGPAQIAEFKVWWDSKLEGETAARRGTMFVGDGTSVINTKESILTDKYDEYLIRIICFCLGISPAPFVSMMNRATAETSMAQAKDEGLGPMMQWVKSMMDLVIARFFDAADEQFVWQEEDETDQLTKAKVNDIKIRNGTKLINEARAEDGADPVEGGDVPLIISAGGATLLSRVIDPPDPVGTAQMPEDSKDITDNVTEDKEKETEKLNKAVNTKVAIAAALVAAFKELPASIASQVMLMVNKASKDNKEEAARLLAAINLSQLDAAKAQLEAGLAQQAKKSGLSSLIQLGTTDQDMFNLVPDIAARIAAERAAELLSSDASGGELGESTRLLIRGTIAEALEEGWTVVELSDALANDYAFSSDRADTIADTEIRNAINQGELQSWKASGVVVGKEWLLSNDEGICDICEGNADQGTVPIDGDFSSGDDAPPAHPNCRCAMAPVTSTDADTGEE